MDDIAGVYALETVEQMRAVADELRLRIMRVLSRQPMTVTQLGRLLGKPPPTTHYHVRELERVGLVQLVEKREKGGVLEKYYRSVARNIVLTPTLLASVPTDESIATAYEFLHTVAERYAEALSRVVRMQSSEPLSLADRYLWLTGEELRQVVEQIQAIVAPFGERRGLEGEYERTFVQIVYNTRPTVPEEPVAREVANQPEDQQ